MRAELVERSKLGSDQRDAMYAILCGQFQGVSRDQFESDLSEKNWAVLLRAVQDERLRGFSTLHVQREDGLDGVEVGVVYSGDTVVDGGPGMGSSLSKAWIGAVNTLRRAEGFERLYWLLLTSGYRTYRFLPVYWSDFHPRHDAPMPPERRRLMETLAAARFGPLFDRGAGIVRFTRPQLLRDELRGIPEHRLADPHIAFFAHANPGHEGGDELVCLTELTEENLTSAGRRMWRGGDRLFEAAGMLPSSTDPPG